MAVCVVSIMPNGTQENYDAVTRQLGMDTADPQFPQGALAHIAGPIEGGGWCIVGEWESRQDFEQFLNGKLMPALQALGLPSDGQRPTIFSVYREFGVGHEDSAMRRAA